MDDYSSAKHRADAAIARCREDFADALAAFEQLKARHRLGNRTRAAGEEFRAKVQRVHADAEEVRASHDALRRALTPQRSETPGSRRTEGPA